MNVGKFGKLVFLAVLRGGESFGIRESAAEMRSGGKARSAGDFRNGKFAFEQIFFCVVVFCFALLRNRTFKPVLTSKACVKQNAYVSESHHPSKVHQ